MSYLINPYLFAGGGTPFWKLLGSTKLGSAGDTIQVASFDDMPYLMVQYHIIPSGSLDNIAVQFNSDTASSYAYHVQTDGGSPTAATNVNFVRFRSGGAVANDFFGVFFMVNKSASEKLLISNQTRNNTDGAGNAPSRAINAGKWANTSNSVTTLDISQDGSGSFDTDSEVVVLGYDPAGSSGDTVWEELADVTLGTTSDNISSGTITAKKYLWAQVFTIAAGENTVKMQLNNDVSNNYSYRVAQSGAESTQVNIDEIHVGQNSGDGTFTNIFMVNDSDQEKLVISNSTEQSSAGAGNASARTVCAGKWANTTASITEIDINNTHTGDFAAGTHLKVWGYDP